MEFAKIVGASDRCVQMTDSVARASVHWALAKLAGTTDIHVRVTDNAARGTVQDLTARVAGGVDRHARITRSVAPAIAAFSAVDDQRVMLNMSVPGQC